MSVTVRTNGRSIVVRPAAVSRHLATTNDFPKHYDNQQCSYADTNGIECGHAGLSAFCFSAGLNPTGLCGVGGVFSIRRSTSSSRF